MWGEKWGEMIWGNPNIIIPVAIPIDGLWLFILGIILGATAIIARRNKMARLASFSLILLVPVVAVFAVNLPHTFTNGTVADADEVNANFEALANSASSDAYEVIVNIGERTSKRIQSLDREKMQNLCADANGCKVIICDITGISLPICNATHFSLTSENGSFSIGFFTNGMFQVEQDSIDGGNVDIILETRLCSLSDADEFNGTQYIDSSLGFSLRLDMPTSGPYDCTITFQD